MHHIVTNAQLSFFKENGWIEFADLLTEKECDTAYQFSLDKEKTTRDSFRKNNSLFKIARKRSLASITAQLTTISPLRIVLDFFIRPSNAKDIPFSSDKSLESQFCFQNLAGFFFLCLSDSSNKEKESIIIPQTKGNGVFLSANFTFPFSSIYAEKEQTFYCIGYGSTKTLYIQNPSDPFTHDLKALGLTFGDKLPNELFPLMLKS